jgi:hypothetical protein
MPLSSLPCVIYVLTCSSSDHYQSVEWVLLVKFVLEFHLTVWTKTRVYDTDFASVID